MSVSLSVDKKFETAEIVVIHSEKGTIATLELFFEGHSADSRIDDLLELQIQSFLIYYYSSPTPPL